MVIALEHSQQMIAHAMSRFDSTVSVSSADGLPPLHWALANTCHGSGRRGDGNFYSQAQAASAQNGFLGCIPFLPSTPNGPVPILSVPVAQGAGTYERLPELPQQPLVSLSAFV